MITDNKSLIRFVNTAGEVLFNCESKKRVKKHNADGSIELCIVEAKGDGAHFKMNGNYYHIDEYTNILNRTGAWLEPEEYPVDLNFFEKHYFDRCGEWKRPSVFYLLTEIGPRDYIYPVVASAPFHLDPDHQICLIEKPGLNNRQFMSADRFREWLAQNDLPLHVRGQVMAFLNAWLPNTR